MRLERDGCYLREAAVSEDQCEEIISCLADISTAGSRDLLSQSWCSRLAEQIRICLSVDISELSKLKAVQCSLFQKTDRRNWLVAWHQDRSLPTHCSSEGANDQRIRTKHGVSLYQPDASVLEKVLAVRLHLDANIKTNGPLRVLVGSHSSGLLGTDGLKRAQATHAAKTVLAKKGALFYMRPLLVHASSKATTNEYRRVLHFVYA